MLPGARRGLLLVIMMQMRHQKRVFEGIVFGVTGLFGDRLTALVPLQLLRVGFGGSFGGQIDRFRVLALLSVMAEVVGGFEEGDCVRVLGALEVVVALLASRGVGGSAAPVGLVGWGEV